MAETATQTLEQQRVPTAEEFNRVIAAAKEQGGNRIVPAEDDKQQVETVFERTVIINGQSLKFQGATPESVLDQVTAAVSAAGTIKPPEVKTVETPKPPVTEKDLFEIGQKIIAGDVKALDAYLDKTDYVKRTLAAQGINVDELKKATQVALNTETSQAWVNATDEFLKMPGNDWPGGEQNQELLGMMIAKLGLKPSAANIKLAYDELKSKNMLFPGEKQTDNQPKRRTSSSTAFGTGAGPERQKPSNGTGPSISKSAFDNAKSQQERDRIYNAFINAGGDPKKPNWVA